MPQNTQVSTNMRPESSTSALGGQRNTGLGWGFSVLALTLAGTQWAPAASCAGAHWVPAKVSARTENPQPKPVFRWPPRAEVELSGRIFVDTCVFCGIDPLYG